MIKDTATSTHMIKPATAIFIRQSLLQFRIVDFVSQPSCDNAMMETMKETQRPPHAGPNLNRSPLFLLISASFYKSYSPATSLHAGFVPPLADWLLSTK